MSNQPNTPKVDHSPAMLDRRKFLVAGMGFAAAALLARAADIQTEATVGAKPIAVRAYGAT
jgi:hypothetical protein